MNTLHQSDTVSLYALEPHGDVNRFIVSTPQTRAICNDPFVLGTQYTRTLQQAMAASVGALSTSIDWGREQEALVLHILRGGLNFGLRDALHDALNWNTHSSAYISSQRARDENGDWYISENRYQKVAIPKNATLIFGDVVATGVSLEHALKKMVEIARSQESSIGQIIFFTIGGDRAAEILAAVDADCRAAFPDYQGSSVVYIEGVFGVADENSPLQIRLTGTDLLRSPAVMAPEFVTSQQDAIAYPLERCTIYDAGSRAFHVEEYIEDAVEYWTQVRALAEGGVTLTAYLKERFPESEWLHNESWASEHDTIEALQTIADQQLAKAEALS